MMPGFDPSFNAETLGAVSTRPVNDLANIESDLGWKLPETLRRILASYGGAIIFNNEVRFRPFESTGFGDESGCHSLDIVYGIASDINGIRERNSSFNRQVGEGFFAIGESSAGNVICIDMHSSRVLFWHHEAPSLEASFFTVADNFDAFMGMLEIVDGDNDSDGDKIVESFLNF